MWCCQCWCCCTVPSDDELRHRLEEKLPLKPMSDNQPTIIQPVPLSKEIHEDAAELISNSGSESNSNHISNNKYYLQYEFASLKKRSLVEEVDTGVVKDNMQEWISVKDNNGDIVEVPATYLAKIRDIEEEPWYFLNIKSRDDAEFFLDKADPEDGIYLVRKCSSGTYVLSVKREKILENGSGDVKEFIVNHYEILEKKGLFGPEDDEIFVTLASMLDYYIEIGYISKPCPKERVIEILPSEIVREKEIGTGAYGIVYRATWRDRRVAVKEMQQIADFTAEIQLISQFQHPQIVTMYGANIASSPHFMVMEYMCNDSLKNYVHNNKLKLEQNLYILEQIADGMRYLAKFKVLHRDLAARNILVGNELCVKISDFGLSRRLTAKKLEGGDKIEENVYYMNPVGYRVPTLWLAIESLFRCKFTVKSDVWMFGILAMEVFTQAKRPYSEFRATTDEVISLLGKGIRMSRPESMPEYVYTMVHRCWSAEPDKRPTFEELYLFFSGTENLYKVPKNTLI